MTGWLLVLGPMVLGALTWLLGGRFDLGRHRTVLCLTMAAILLGLVAGSVLMLVTEPSSAIDWAAGLAISIAVDRQVAVAVVLVAVIAAAVIAWAAAHESDQGLARLLGLELAFAGAMELLVMAGDLLTLAIAWELVGGLSWALIGHRVRDDTAVRSANYAFITTRAGGLGLWLAAGASLAGAGTLSFDELSTVAQSSAGHLFAAGIVIAAAAKSAQGPFGPWLFRAMDGPTSVSGLLHSATMVAAGAWLLLRLHEPLSLVAWFGPVAITLGLVTAGAGGLVASVQTHGKKVLAASTSAQLGVVFVAAGAGATGAGLAHLIAHAACKALLFMTTGIAIAKAGTTELGKMQLGRRLPGVALASAVGAISLAALPPIGTSWSKEHIIAATGHISPALAVVTIVVAAWSAWYAIRFQVLAYGRERDDNQRQVRLSGREMVPVWLLASASVGFAAVWWPDIERMTMTSLPDGWAARKPWELILSIATVSGAALAAWLLYRRGRLVELGRAPDRAWLADWLGLPVAIDRVIVRPTLALARGCVAVDARLVDGGVRAASRAACYAAAVVARGVERVVDGGVRAASRAACFAAAVVARGVERLVTGAVWLLAYASLAVAKRSARVDDEGIDGSIETVAAGIGRSAQLARRAQPGTLPTYYSLVVTGFLLVVTGLLVALVMES